MSLLNTLEYSKTLNLWFQRNTQYAKTAAGVIVPILVDASGKLIIDVADINNNLVAKENIIVTSAEIIALDSTYASANQDLIDRFAIGVQCIALYHAAATLGVDIQIFQSQDGADYDTVPFIDEPIDFLVNATVAKSFLVYTSFRYIRIDIVNNDPAQQVTVDVNLTKV